jgi:hypothetical protein
MHKLSPFLFVGVPNVDFRKIDHSREPWHRLGLKGVGTSPRARQTRS